MIMNGEFGRMGKENVMTYFEALSHLPGGSEENHKHVI
jgi:hypothetical protein